MSKFSELLSVSEEEVADEILKLETFLNNACKQLKPEQLEAFNACDSLADFMVLGRRSPPLMKVKVLLHAFKNFSEHECRGIVGALYIPFSFPELASLCILKGYDTASLPMIALNRVTSVTFKKWWAENSVPPGTTETVESFYGNWCLSMMLHFILRRPVEDQLARSLADALVTLPEFTSILGSSFGNRGLSYAEASLDLAAIKAYCSVSSPFFVDITDEVLEDTKVIRDPNSTPQQLEDAANRMARSDGASSHGGLALRQAAMMHENFPVDCLFDPRVVLRSFDALEVIKAKFLLQTWEQNVEFVARNLLSNAISLDFVDNLQLGEEHTRRMLRDIFDLWVREEVVSDHIQDLLVKDFISHIVYFMPELKDTLFHAPWVLREADDLSFEEDEDFGLILVTSKISDPNQIEVFHSIRDSFTGSVQDLIEVCKNV